MTILPFFCEHGSKPVLFSASKHLITFDTSFVCWLCLNILLGLRFDSETDAGLASVLFALYIERKSSRYAVRFQIPQNWISPQRKEFFSILLDYISDLLLIFICCSESEAM